MTVNRIWTTSLYTWHFSLLLLILPHSICVYILCTLICVDGILIGGRSVEYPGTQLFSRGKTSTKLCLPAGSGRDSHVCEAATVGTIRLINTSTITPVEPSITRITITDDECGLGEREKGSHRIILFFSPTVVLGTFSQSSYTFQEGSSTQHMTVNINSGLEKSLNLHLTPGRMGHRQFIKHCLCYNLEYNIYIYLVCTRLQISMGRRSG